MAPREHEHEHGHAHERASRVEEIIERAAQAFERREFKRALALAEDAGREDARSVAAHHYRGAALAELGRLEDAEEAYARALELDEDDPETLLGASEFLICHRGEDRDAVEEGLQLAARAKKIAHKAGDRDLEAELALLQATGHNAVGAAEDALECIEEAQRRLGPQPDVLLEKGLALFELCRFKDAQRALEEMVRKSPDDAWAHHHLALVLERNGDPRAAERHFARARKLAPDDFPRPVHLDPGAFDAAVQDALARLPAKVREHLHNVSITVKDLPDELDLRGHAHDHPLSPTILGLFRGPNLRDRTGHGEMPPSITLFQKNLERFARTRSDLVEQIGITLIHEVGHYLGLEEEELWERGLE